MEPLFSLQLTLLPCSVIKFAVSSILNHSLHQSLRALLPSHIHWNCVQSTITNPLPLPHPPLKSSCMHAIAVPHDPPWILPSPQPLSFPHPLCTFLASSISPSFRIWDEVARNLNYFHIAFCTFTFTLHSPIHLFPSPWIPCIYLVNSSGQLISAPPPHFRPPSYSFRSSPSSPLQQLSTSTLHNPITGETTVPVALTYI